MRIRIGLSIRKASLSGPVDSGSIVIANRSASFCARSASIWDRIILVGLGVVSVASVSTGAGSATGVGVGSAGLVTLLETLLVSGSLRSEGGKLP